MIVDHPGSLHEGVANRGPYKSEAALLQVLTHGVALFRARRHLVAPGIPHRAPTHETPDVGIEGAELLLYREEGLGIGHRGIHLQAIAHDPGILQQRRHFAFAVARHFARVEAVEDFAIAIAKWRRCW